jgi:outer membrane receptor protein involved in Fe transport
MNSPKINGLVLALLLTIGLRNGLPAQTVPAPAPAPPDLSGAGSDQPIVLSPFAVDVERDRGYIAVDSLAGGRTNTPIKYTPSAISSLTRTFIDDLGVTNIRDALQWTVNVVPGDWFAGKQSSNPFNAWDYNFRGAGQSLQGGAGPTRNYFTFYQVADSYNIDRIEADRGPNSILYGVGTVGGVLTVYTKAPRLDKDFVAPAVSLDNHGSYRFELDVNERLADNLALRLNAVEDHTEGWRRGDVNRFDAADLAVLYKPGDNTSVRVEVETSKARKTLISSTAPEAVSGWDGTTSSPVWGTAPSGAGVDTMKQWGPARYNVWVAGKPSLGLQDWFPGLRSTGVFLPVAPRRDWYPSTMVNGDTVLDGAKIPVLPNRDFTFGSGISRPEYNDLTAYLDHTFGENFDAELSLYRYTDRHSAQDYEGLTWLAYDLNRQLPNGAANPNFGQLYGDFFLSRQQQNRSVTEYRAQVNYHFDARPFGVSLKQRFSLAVGDQKITWHARENIAQITDGASADWQDNMVWARLYLDQANTSPDLPAAAGGRAIAYAPTPVDFFDFDETTRLKNVSLASQSLIWDDRLSVLLGVRHDHYRHHKVLAHSGTVTDDSASGTTYSAGGIFYFIKSLGAFFNYSKNFDPIGPGKSPGLDGQPFGPATGEGYEYGLRLSTDDGKYYATLNRYDDKSKDRITTSKIDLAGIWKQYYMATGQSADPAKTLLAFDDTEALQVSGYEFEMTANPTQSLRIQLGYSQPDAKIVEAMPGQRAYYAANLPTWNAAAGGASDAATNLKNLLTNARTQLDQNTAGMTKTGLVRYTANLFANYTFLDDALKGYSIGAGVAETGRQYLTSIDGQKWYSSSRVTANAVLAYETTFGRVRARFALNIDNVFNKRDPIITSYDGAWKDGAGRPIPNGYYFQTPRTFRFWARFTF